MKRALATIFLAGLLTAALVSPSKAEPMSISGEQDIGALMQTAGQIYDLENEDAVFLFKGRKEYWTPDGRRITMMHRITWLRTEYAINRYADLRIPWDSAHQTFRKTALRTWRDNKWIVSGPTAVVETLPFAVDRADDYTNMRETMLLHDGIELPCIIETAYVIEDVEPYRDGASGVWTFPRGEPAVMVSFTLGVPAGSVPHYAVHGDIPRPVKGSDEERGLDTYTFTMNQVDALPRPRTDEMIREVPRVTWSTWESWGDLGQALRDRFTGAMETDSALAAALEERLETAATPVDSAEKVAAFVGEATRLIRYDEDWWWPMPRPAARTYATAYGHRLDRAVLAAALFREAGFEVWPVFRGEGYGDVNDGVPALEGLDGVAVWVSGRGVEAYYDPSSSDLHNGLAPIYGRAVWLPGVEDSPAVRWSGTGEASRMTVRLDLSYDGAAEKWTGRGVLQATGGLCPYDRMAGLEDEARSTIEEIVGGLLPGAEVGGYNATTFDRFTVTAGFDFTAPAGERDDLGRVRLELGEPGEGIFDHLPGHVRLYEPERGSGVHLPGVMVQTVDLRLDAGGLELVRLPEESRVQTPMGSFTLTVDREEDTIHLVRSLSLGRAACSAEEWPNLRRLLLAEEDARGKVLLFR